MNPIKESTDRAFHTNIHDIIIAGDFNFNMTPNVNNKITDLMLKFKFITDPTHFTENHSSIIDLIFVHNRANVFDE